MSDQDNNQGRTAARMSSFEVLKEMSRRDLDVRIATLDNISNMRKTKHGTRITINIEGDDVIFKLLERGFVGGLVLADRKQFLTVRDELQRDKDKEREGKG